MGNYFGLSPSLFPFNNAAINIAGGPNNKAAFRWSQAQGTTDAASTVTFGTNTQVRYILVKPSVANTAGTPNQTSNPNGVAGQGFGYNPSSTWTDAYVVLEKVKDSYTGFIMKTTKPTVVSSPWAGYGNAFQFTAVGPSDGYAADEYGHVNFGAGYGFADNTAFTLDFRYKRERVNQPEVLAGWMSASGNNSEGALLVQHNAVNNKIEVTWYNGGAYDTITSTTAPALNDLVVVRVTYDGTTMRLYINGTLEASKVNTILGPTTAEFYVARCAWPGYGSNQGNPAKITLDSVRISNIARTTGASYTVETTPVAVDANTTLLCDFEGMVTARHVLKAGAIFFVRGFLTASQADALSTTFGLYCNVYKRSAAGTYTYLCGGSSGLVAAPLALAEFGFNTSTLASDVIFENGDTFHFEYWVSGRGGGTTGLLSQVLTFTTGYPGALTAATGVGYIGTSGSTAKWGLLFDKAPTGAVTPAATVINTYTKYFTGLFTAAKVAGGLTKRANKALDGLFTSAKIVGGLTKISNKFFLGQSYPGSIITQLTNGSYEDPTLNVNTSYGVSGYFGASVTKDTTESHSLGASIKVVTNNVPNAAQPQGFIHYPAAGNVVLAGTRMRGYAWVKAPVGAQLYISGRFETAAGGHLGEDGGLTSFTGTGDWQFVSTGIWSPSQDAICGIQVKQQSGGSVITFWADDVVSGPEVPSVIKTANKYFIGSVASSGLLKKFANKYFVAGSTPTGALTKIATRYLTGAISSIVGAIRKVPNKYPWGAVRPGANQLSVSKSGMEDGTLSGWSLNNALADATLVNTQAVSHSGERSLLLTKGSGYAFILTSESVSFGSNYEVHAWIRPSTSTIQITFRENGTGNAFSPQVLSVTPNAWNLIRRTYTPTNSSVTSLGFDFGWEAPDATAGSTLYLDDVWFQSSPNLLKTPNKLFTAALTPAGANIKWLVLKYLGGALTPVGTVFKKAFKYFTGSAGTPSGALRNVPNKYFTGAILPSPGTLLRAVVKYFTATITPSGTLTKQPVKLLLATIASSSASVKFTIVKYFKGFLYNASGDGTGGTNIIKKMIINIFED